MSVLNNSNAIETGGYNIQRSLRFRSSASAYLNRTPATTSNQTTWSWSGWVKRGTLGAEQHLFGCGTAGTNNFQFFFSSTDNLQVNAYIGGTTVVVRQTNAVFRDPSAWYHVELVADTNNATQANRMLLYVNGVSQSLATSYALGSGQTFFINTNIAHYSGKYWNTGGYFDGYLAEVNFIDGQALTPSSFGQTDPVTGVWQPKKYAGTYGTNGFYLPFSDNTSATTLAYDKSGNGNNWTPNNISTTAGATYDSMTDVPTLTSATAANFAVMNPLLKVGTSTYAGGNLDVTVGGSAVIDQALSSIALPSSGKWYAEFTCTTVAANYSAVSLAYIEDGIGTGQSPRYSYRSDGNKFTYATSSAYGNTWTTNDIIGVAVDMTNQKLYWSKNGTWQNSGDPAAGTNPAFSSIGTNPCYLDVCNLVISGSSGQSAFSANFGQRPFSYTPPTGFKALNTFNLPDPTIKKPNQYMDATTYTGTGATQTVTNSGSMQPDFVWTKCRNNVVNNILVDAVRGGTKILFSDLTNAEQTSAFIDSFNSNGWTVSSSAGTGGNQSGYTYVGWQWKKGATPGFDIVTYTGNGTAGRTVNHSLGVTPAMQIVKCRSNAATNWATWQKSLLGSEFLYMNTTGAKGTGNSSLWNGTTPNSTTFTVGTDNDTNANGYTYVAYLFAEIPGFSKFGSYTGNGSTDGPFVYCGFRPKYVMTKCTSGVGDWHITDTSRFLYNGTNAMGYLDANTSAAEGAYAIYDGLSNGFKIRDNGSVVNTNGGTYIYAAFAENPFKYSLAR